MIADRRFGVGCDQVLLIEPARDAATQFHFRIFNSDGSEAEQCGNGARCVARFVRDRGLTQRDVIDVGTSQGPIHLYLEGDGQVRVDMAPPKLLPQEIPFNAPKQSDTYKITVAGQTLEVGAVSMGNPHAVLLVDNIGAAPVATLGPLLEAHPRFPQRANVGFMAVSDRHHIELRVYERGAGETLACGTGACAAVVSGILRGLLETQVWVSLPGGRLKIDWAGIGASVWMTGPADYCFEGQLLL